MDNLRGEHLVKRYGKRTVVAGVTIDVSRGEVVGLLGPNGAGKTTTFYMIVGMIRPEDGRVFLNDTELTNKAMFRRARLGIGYLPQETSVFRKLSVEDNILAVLELLPLNHKQRKDRAEQLLEELNITHIRKSPAYVLSGGERRRTEIARALAMSPKFILLDEPFAGIDPLAVEEIMTIIKNLSKKEIGVLITDHNVHETLSITDRSYILIDGHIFRAGTPQQLADDQDVRRLYLGEKFTLERYEG